MTPEKCPHCGMMWNEAMGEYECGSYQAGSSVVRATACKEIARLKAQLSQLQEARQ